MMQRGWYRNCRPLLRPDCHTLPGKKRKLKIRDIRTLEIFFKNCIPELSRFRRRQSLLSTLIQKRGKEQRTTESTQNWEWNQYQKTMLLGLV